jgi:hypothetical protein
VQSENATQSLSSTVNGTDALTNNQPVAVQSSRGYKKKYLAIFLICIFLVLVTFFAIKLLAPILQQQFIALPIRLNEHDFDESGIVYAFNSIIKNVESNEETANIFVDIKTPGAPSILRVDKLTTILFIDPSSNLKPANLSDLRINQRVITGAVYTLKSKRFTKYDWRASYILIPVEKFDIQK